VHDPAVNVTPVGAVSEIPENEYVIAEELVVEREFAAVIVYEIAEPMVIVGAIVVLVNENGEMIVMV